MGAHVMEAGGGGGRRGQREKSKAEQVKNDNDDTSSQPESAYDGAHRIKSLLRRSSCEYSTCRSDHRSPLDDLDSSGKICMV